jgi:hypothetical protein
VKLSQIRKLIREELAKIKSEDSEPSPSQVMDFYWLAGTALPSGAIKWADSEMERPEHAEEQAVRMSKRFGGRPVVKYWRKKDGEWPVPEEAIVGRYWVQSIRPPMS